MKTPDAIDGISYLPVLLGKQQTEHEFMYWEFHEEQAVRMGKWKGVRLLGEPLELYDLSKDIGEAKNVADKHPDIVKKIDAYLKTARTESEFWPLRGGR